MDNLFEQLETLSNDLLHNFQWVTFEEISDYMAKREEIFLELKIYEASAADKVKHRDIVKRIQSLDPIILAKMEQLKSEAEKELTKFSSGRIQKSAYDGEHQSSEGIFFDKKK